MPNLSRAGALALAFLFLVLSVLSLSCGGRGGDPVVPPAQPPPATNPYQDPPDTVQGWRLQLTDTSYKPSGKLILEGMPVPDKIIDLTWGESRFLRFQLHGKLFGTWFMYAGLDTARLDIRSVGMDSGKIAPTLEASPAHDSSFTDTFIWEVRPVSGSGTLNYVAEVYDDTLGALCYMHFGLRIHPKTSPPPPPPPPPPVKTCRQSHPTKEAINGYWWDCVGGIWENTGVPVVNPPPPPPPSKDIFPLQGQLGGFYSGSGQQSLTLELKPLPTGVGFINWEILSGPSGAMTVPLGCPAVQCEFYYTAAGSYVIRATPFESEQSFDSGKPAVGKPAEFTVVITAG